MPKTTETISVTLLRSDFTILRDRAFEQNMLLDEYISRVLEEHVMDLLAEEEARNGTYRCVAMLNRI